MEAGTDTSAHQAPASPDASKAVRLSRRYTTGASSDSAKPPPAGESDAESYARLHWTRRWTGERMDQARDFMSTNLRPIRWGVSALTVVTVWLVFSRTRPMVRYTRIADVPAPLWQRRRKLRVSVEGYSEDGSAVLVYHWPLMRRLFFADKAPQTTQDCLLLRPFGTTQPVEGGLKQVLPKGQFVTCQLLWRAGTDEACSDVGVGNILVRERVLSRRSTASRLLVKAGLATVEHAHVPGLHADTSASGLRVIQRLRQKLLDEEAYARRHRLGVWREHVEAEVVPTGVRAMMKAVRRVFNRMLGRGGPSDDALRATPTAAPTGVNSTGEALTNSYVGDGSSKPGHGTGNSGEAQPQPSASNTQEHSGSGASSERVGSSRSDGPRAVGGGEVRAVVKQAAKQAVASSVSGLGTVLGAGARAVRDRVKRRRANREDAKDNEGGKQ